MVTEVDIGTDPKRLRSAYETVREELFAAREPGGHWVGELASSSLPTATAICALVIAEQYGRPESHGRQAENLFDTDQIFQGDLSELILTSLHWLAAQQNDDGGWGDTDASKSNIATTMLAVAAFRLTGVPAQHADLLERAGWYITSRGGVARLRRRYGRDKTFAAPILACCALAGMVPWRDVPALPFELVCLPRSWHRIARLPVVSYAIPALVAIGQARHHHAPPLNPIRRMTGGWAATRSLEAVEAMQPESGGFLEATPLTSFVVMCLASIGLAEHLIVRRGVEFLLASVRPDGSWPIDTNLATWNTTLAMNALHDEHVQIDRDQDLECLDWLLDCQHVKTHPFTDIPPGGWAWTDLTGGVPDVDDTSGALLALIGARKSAPESRLQRIDHAARTGIYWLLDMQNRDGGWPTFCRGWGKLPFDRSAADLTAHALRAIDQWRKVWQTRLTDPRLDRRLAAATDRGLAFLGRQQREDGSWLPLWFGNQNNADDVNPVYGTARVLKALVEIGRADLPMVRRGANWLAGHQHASGGWGAVAPDPETDDDASRFTFPACSVEETSVAVSALVPLRETDREVRAAAAAGLTWLVEAVESGRFRECSPVGFYFAKLWYYERLYPLVFSAEALGTALSSAAGEAVRDERHPIYSAEVATRATAVGK